MVLNKKKIPSELKTSLPQNGRKSHPLYFADDEVWLFADPKGLFRFDGTTTSWSWHEVQQVTWNRDTDTLSVTWPDPGKEALELKNPDIDMLKEFGDYARVFLQKSQVYTQFFTTPSGTKVRVAVRRREDGTCFSEVVAFGTLRDSDLPALDKIESEVRDMAGLSA